MWGGGGDQSHWKESAELFLKATDVFSQKIRGVSNKSLSEMMLNGGLSHTTTAPRARWGCAPRVSGRLGHSRGCVRTAQEHGGHSRALGCGDLDRGARPVYLQCDCRMAVSPHEFTVVRFLSIARRLRWRRVALLALRGGAARAALAACLVVISSGLACLSVLSRLSVALFHPPRAQRTALVGPTPLSCSSCSPPSCIAINSMNKRIFCYSLPAYDLVCSARA